MELFSVETLKKFEEFDKMKTRVMKYILYRKRTENEVRNKFNKEIDNEILEKIIIELKNQGYINDEEYIKSAVKEQMNINLLSIKELRYKLYTKGLKNSIIELYIEKNLEMLEQYEEESARKIFNKKIKSKEIDEVKFFLLKKGYKNKIVEKVSEENAGTTY